LVIFVRECVLKKVVGLGHRVIIAAPDVIGIVCE
jgi:hypothetical protein